MDKILVVDSPIFKETINLEKEKESSLMIIDLLEDNVDFELDINLAYNSKCDLSVFSFNFNKVKDYKLTMHHSTDKGISDSNVYAVNQGDSHTKAKVMSIVSRGTNLNETYQNLRAVNLDSNSQFTGEPMLKVDNNNIKAKHEMAVGQVNVDQLFYLMSRGLSAMDAKKLVILGHFKKIVHKLSPEKQEEYINYVQDRLSINAN